MANYKLLDIARSRLDNIDKEEAEQKKRDEYVLMLVFVGAEGRDRTATTEAVVKHANEFEVEWNVQESIERLLKLGYLDKSVESEKLTVSEKGLAAVREIVHRDDKWTQAESVSESST